MTSPNIVVVGSCMIDFTSYCPRLPKEGETIHGTKFKTAFGGKGGNQCVAAAKLGGKTALVARLGDDTWGRQYVTNLKDLNVDSSFLKISPNVSSGIAQINVDESGANQIVIIAGANSYLSEADVENAKEIITNAAVVLCQLETKWEVAVKTLKLSRGISILNGAPAVSECDGCLFSLPTIFCVNEHEASIFAGVPVENLRDAKAAIKILLGKGCNTVLLTMGSQGSILASKKSPDPIHVPSRDVQCTDSTGAGDSFIGTLAYLLANREDIALEKCVEISNYVAADSVTRLGTQSSFAGPEILEQYFNSYLGA